MDDQMGIASMPESEISLQRAEPDLRDSDRPRRDQYLAAYREFAGGLTSPQRRQINGASAADWAGRKTFALPVQPDSPAFSLDESDPVSEVLAELEGLNGALPKIALWLNDRMGGLDMVKSLERFRIAVARICEAKNPRLEAHCISLAIGMNLSGNSNGFAVARHFRLTPQALHEMLGETCAALGVDKPLSKMKKDRYSATQFRHNLRRKTIVPTSV